MFVGVAFLVFLTILAPARVATKFIQVNDLELKNTGGTVWHGHADARFRQQELGQIHWNISVLRLFQGTVAIDFELTGTGLYFQGVHTRSNEGSQLSVDGLVAAHFINSHLLNYDIRLAGDFSLLDVKLELKDDQTVESIGGDIKWTGGPARFSFAESVYAVELDAIHGVLRMSEEDLLLEVHRESNERKLLTVRLEPNTGWLHMRATKAFLEFTHISPSHTIKDSDFAFEVSERIY